MGRYKEGQKVQIIAVADSISGPEYRGRKGVIDYIDSQGTVFGTWGALGLIPGVDMFKIIE